MATILAAVAAQLQDAGRLAVDSARTDSLGVGLSFSLPTGDLLVLLVAGGIVCFGIGLWIARPLPGRLREDAEQLMTSGAGRRMRVRRSFTPVAWLQRNVKIGGSRRRFEIERPGRR